MIIDSPDRAKRFARAIVSDIALYNKDLIRKGIEDDSLFQLLDEDLQKGRQLYEGRVAPDILKTSNYYNRAIVDVLVKQFGAIKSRIW